MSETSKYVKLTQIEHILARPDTYIGNPNKSVKERWIVNEENKCELLATNISDGAMKCVDEILTNARDRIVEQSLENKCNEIRVNIEGNIITVMNNGDGIPILPHEEYENIYIPELIFGHLLTSTNYDDTQTRVAGGRNGLGAKLTNVFSTKFEIETIDHKRKKKYVQTFEKNLSVINNPTISSYSKKPYTKVSFELDWNKFNMNNIDTEFVSTIRKRVYDIAATIPSFCSKTKVYYQDNLVDINTFDKYMSLFYEFDKMIYEVVNDRWKVGIAILPHNGFHHVTYVNSMPTYNGGTHLNYITDQICKKVVEQIKTKNKITTIKPIHVKEHIVVFIDSLIENPTFNSQTKEELTTPIKDFGSTCVISQKMIDRILKSGIINVLIDLQKMKDNSTMNKTDGKKVNKIRGLPKLEDAEYAGTVKSKQCMLILTEGDSAKASAMAGLSVIGKKEYGIFPLKGKLLNVRDASNAQILKNEEIQNLKKILGLKQGEKYENTSQLRYGKGIIIFTDQDVDGSHIKGLLMNFIHHFWPSLVLEHDYISCLTTPIVKAFKGKEKQVFYNLSSYEEWKKNIENIKGWNIKYYKGLGTSTSQEAKEYFVDMKNKLIIYEKDDLSENSFELAFSKEKANMRKEWLKNYDKNEIISNDVKRINYTDFINKELIHFSNDDTHRSIPSVIDGLKPSQRKILYGAFMRQLDKSEIKVSQLSGFVSDKACYHHGEASLNGAIIGMASNYVGSNNIEWLVPNGQFGTRIQGGKDHASPRYIWTSINKVITKIIRKEDNDILEYNNDDGIVVEPTNYLPIIPMVLVNGAEGIGTGFSTNIPPYNPKELIDILKTKLKGNSYNFDTIKPYYRGFDGNIVLNEDKSYMISGNYNINKKKVTINELPIGLWTSSYKEYLNDLIEKKIIEDFTDDNTDINVEFNVTFKTIPEDIEKILKINKIVRTSNMHLFTSEYHNNSHIKKYENIEEIIDDYMLTRIKGYENRKKYQLEKLQEDIKILSNKFRFIEMIIRNELIINNRAYKDIIKDLEENKFILINESYEYLINMKLYQLTKEKMDELETNLFQKRHEYETLMHMSETNMWLNELDELSQVLNMY